jgi:Amt family ammonium transporter
LALGLFADGTYGDGWNSVKGTVTGLFYGDASQFVAQCINVIVNIIFVFIAAYLTFKLIDVIIGNRVSAEVEVGGLDIPETGVLAYPDFVLAKSERKETANGELG